MSNALTSQPKNPSRFSIAGMLLLVAVIAIHLAVLRTSFTLVRYIVPFSLSVVSLAVLRWTCKLRSIRTLVVCGLFIGVSFAASISAIQYANALQAPPVPNMAYYKSISLYHGFFLKLAVNLGWYLFAMTLVTVVYSAFIFRDDRSVGDVRKKLLRLGDTTEPSNDHDHEQNG